VLLASLARDVNTAGESVLCRRPGPRNSGYRTVRISIRVPAQDIDLIVAEAGLLPASCRTPLLLLLLKPSLETELEARSCRFGTLPVPTWRAGATGLSLFKHNWYGTWEAQLLDGACLCEVGRTYLAKAGSRKLPWPGAPFVW